LHSLKENLYDARAVAFSPDSKSLAAGSSKVTVVYDVETGKVTRKLEMPGFALCWTPKGGLLVTPGQGNIVPHAPDGLAPGPELPVVASALTLSADGANLFALWGAQVTHWQLERATNVRTITVGDSSQ